MFSFSYRPMIYARLVNFIKDFTSLRYCDAFLFRIGDQMRRGDAGVRHRSILGNACLSPLKILLPL